MEINSGVEKVFNKLMQELLIEKIARKKLAEGESLTTEEIENLLQHVYSSSKEKINGFKNNSSLKANIGLSILPAITLFGGEQTKGMYDASRSLKTGVKHVQNNYQLVMKGVSTTSKCQTATNFTTLLDQFKEASNYYVLLGELFTAIDERNASYKKDLATPIVPETQEKLIITRQKVLTLNDQYETNRKMK